jgi:mono/diheme cytochrome c family protein
MREKIAVAVSVLAAVALVTLSAVFARSQNPPQRAGGDEAGAPASPPAAEPGRVPTGGGARPGEPSAAEAPPPDAPAQSAAADSARGFAVFSAQGCARCHSVAGEGNARNPLDGVGARRTPEQLRAWTIGAEVLADSLPPSAYRAKQAFQGIPEAELSHLVAYLSSLRQPPRPD